MSANDAELLIAFEENPSLSSLSSYLGRDQTVISKQLKRISLTGDFLTKANGRWKITQTGLGFNRATKDYILAQTNILKKEVHLTIGTTREFSSKVLSHYLDDLKDRLGVQRIKCMTYDKGIEEALLHGHIDLAIECGRPFSPDIIFKEKLHEPIVPVISKKLDGDFSTVSRIKDLEQMPHILCDRLIPNQIFKKKFTLKKISAHTNDMSTAINLCLNGKGWALLPVYAIKKELQAKQLKIIKDDFCNKGIKFGAWQYKKRSSLSGYFNSLVQWMDDNPSLLEL